MTLLREANSDLIDMSILIYFYHADNSIRYLDGHISACTALESLHVCENKLKAIPVEFGACSSLKTLAVANNEITELPLELFDLCNLTNLDVSCNQVWSALLVNFSCDCPLLPNTFP